MPPLGKTANLNLNTFAAALSTECALTALTLTISRELHDEHHSDKDVQRLKAALANAKKLLDISMIPRWTRIGSDMVDR